MTRRAAIAMATLALSAPAGAAQGACWTPAPGESELRFEIEQADAPLEGEFREYDACICLDPADPGSGRVWVEVATASADTRLPELDDELMGPDFFHVDKWPTAVYESEEIRALGDGRFEASGTLTIRDVSRPHEVTFELRISEDGSGAEAEGRTAIKRLDYGIGQGEWSDTRWVGDRVDIRFDVALERAVGTP